MTAATENIAERHVGASTQRVRRYREPRRDGLRLFTVTVSETACQRPALRGRRRCRLHGITDRRAVNPLRPFEKAKLSGIYTAMGRPGGAVCMGSPIDS
jgi:hypothetical protein